MMLKKGLIQEYSGPSTDNNIVVFLSDHTLHDNEKFQNNVEILQAGKL